MTKIVPLVAEEHADLKVNQTAEFSHLKDQHILPLVAHEFVATSSDVPVVFVKNGESGQLQPMAMYGIKPGDNLIIGDDGTWTAHYIPGIVMTYPFRLVPGGQDQNQMALAIDEESNWVSKDQGNAIFNADGSETEYLTKRKEALTTYFEHAQITQGFVQILSDLDLFIERGLTVDVNGDQVNLNGLFFIDENKLNELPDEKFNDLRKRGFLPAIYAHMISVSQIRRLGRLKGERDGSGA